MNHTPGPWLLEPRCDGKCILVGRYDDGQFICEVDTDDVDVDAARANARLIAAAPDLLEALKLMLEGAEEMGGTTSRAAAHNAKVASARVAVAKAVMP